MSLNAKLSRKMETLSTFIIRLTGSNLALLLCFGVVILWAMDGFFAHFSQRWEAIIETISSVITVVMVFLNQKTQFKDSLAIRLKLNELVAANASASNRLVDVEGMSEEELRVLQKKADHGGLEKLKASNTFYPGGGWAARIYKKVTDRK